MTSEALFESFSHDLEESVRVDRESDKANPETKLSLLRKYYVTDSAHHYLADLFARLLGEAEGERQGSNHWLHGYYGSGKSHLLAITRLLLDSEWIRAVGRDEAWEALSGSKELIDLKSLWERCLDDYELWPLIINLLKEQGTQRRGFGNVILRRLREKQGRSPQPTVAAFEDWYLKRHDRETLKEQAATALRRAGANLEGDDLWERVQRYPVLANGVLPELFEMETGERDGLRDVTDIGMDPKSVTEELEKTRQNIEKDCGRPVRLLLLLDEITLFIGTRYNLLTELNALTEAIDDAGQGKLLTVGTAQNDPSRVQTEYVARELDFSILNDRFPHKYSLPSSHVGEIVLNRLLRKSEAGEKKAREVIDRADRSLGDSFTFLGVKQNTEPSLDEIDTELAVQYLPLLPYQPPLFLEILANLRTKRANRAKSIFSGTARAVLAIVEGLLADWTGDKGDEVDLKQVITLVDFFEVIRPELRDIIPKEVETIREVEDEVEEGRLEPVDARVCKVVLLLQQVPDMVPLDNLKNVAVGLMGDLDGKSLIKQVNTVKEALDRLTKYIRHPEGESYRFTSREERLVLNQAEEYRQEFDVEDVLDELVEPSSTFGDNGRISLWKAVIERLGLLQRFPYREGGDLYPVGYTFEIDGFALEETFGEREGLEIEIHVERLLTDEERSPAEHASAFLWKLEEEGRSNLFEDLKRWAALSRACRETTQTPDSIQQQLQEESQPLPERIADRIRNAEFKVRGHTPSTVEKGIRKSIDVKYPDHFHPELLLVTADQLSKLRGIRQTEDLPGWAEKIQVVCDSKSGVNEPIIAKVRGQVGRKLKSMGEGESISVEKALKRLTSNEGLYKGAEPALAALLWGLCQRGDFQPTTESGEPARASEILNPDRWHEVRLRLGSGGVDLEVLRRFPPVTAQDTLNEAIVKARDYISSQKRQTKQLHDQVLAKKDNAATAPVRALLGGLTNHLAQTHDGFEEWLESTQTPNPDWETIADEVLAARNRVQEAADRWDKREAHFLQLDALLLLQKEHLNAIGAQPVEEALNSLREEAESVETTPWWTSDGWTEFVDGLQSRSDATAALGAWWQDVKAEEPRHELYERTEGHAWLVSPMDPTLDGVGETFRRQYLDDLRSFNHSMSRTGELIAPLAGDADQIEIGQIQRALGHMKDGISPNVPAISKAEELLEKMDTLEQVAEVGAPASIKAAGVWPDDRGDLESQLHDLAERKGIDPEVLEEELELEDTENGVLINA